MTFECGCPKGKIDFEDIPLDCPYAWDMICEGNTKGIFQLESGLGKSWALRVQPRSIEELSDLISIIRPGVLESKLDGKSLTQHYVDRKFDKEPVEYIHESLRPILESTYGILVYQEQIIRIARDLAGYTLSEGDLLRKAVGKKLADKMAIEKGRFAEGCERVGIVDKEIAQQIFDWIEKSARYSFNKSHGVSYALTGYYTAYAKAHYEREFMCASLIYAKEKQKPKDEIAELIINCRSDGIVVNSPYLNNYSLNKEDFYIKDNQIYFGLTSIKGIGESQIQKFRKKVLTKQENNSIIDKWSWHDFLDMSCDTKKIMENIVQAGGLDYLHLDRQQMLYDMSIYHKLTANERKWLASTSGSLLDKLRTSVSSFEEYLQDKTKKDKKSISRIDRLEKIKDLIKVLEHPPYSLKDSSLVKFYKEKELLGISITSSVLVGHDTSIGNCTCSEFNSGFDSEKVIICGKITKANSYTIKNGNNAGKLMCFVNIIDDTGATECVIFSREYDKCIGDLYEDNILGFVGVRSYNGRSLAIKDVINI